MEKVILKNSSRGGCAVVEICRDDGRKNEILAFKGIRCGLSWPGPNAPGFYILIGQSMRAGVHGEYPLAILREGLDQIPSELYEKIANDAGAFMAEDIYTDISEGFKGYVLDFWNFKKEKRPRQRLFLRSGPFYQDFSHGVFTIKGWVKKNALVIPEGSLVYEQLKNMTGKDLKENPEEKFYAVNALRFAIGAFEISRGNPLKFRDREQSSAPPVESFT